MEDRQKNVMEVIERFDLFTLTMLFCVTIVVSGMNSISATHYCCI